jgi:RimJ/RimL family protein N-acetyltransferase
MQHDVNRLRCLPATFLAKNGRHLRLELLTEADEHGLAQMYLDYRPRNSFQGLPPLKDEVCACWVQQMVRTGTNVVARDGRPVLGHLALFAVDDGRCEMLVVVTPAFQNFGLGTRLTELAVDLADELGYQKIWLPVEATNVRARHIYAKCGFQYLSRESTRELDMAIDLGARRAKLPPAVPSPHYLTCPEFEGGEVGRLVK